MFKELGVWVTWRKRAQGRLGDIGWTQTVKNHEPARSWIHSEGNEGEQARVLNQKHGTLRSHFEGIPLTELGARAGKRLRVGTQVQSSQDSPTQVK